MTPASYQTAPPCDKEELVGLEPTTNTGLLLSCSLQLSYSPQSLSMSYLDTGVCTTRQQPHLQATHIWPNLRRQMLLVRLAHELKI